MPKLSPAKLEQLVRVLHKLGFVTLRQKGSHVVLRHPDGRWATVPMHKGRDVGKGLLSKILKDAEVSVDEFERLR